MATVFDLNNCVVHDAVAHNNAVTQWADNLLPSTETFAFLHEQVYNKGMYDVYRQMYCCLHGVPGMVVSVNLNKTQTARRRIWHFNFDADVDCNFVCPANLWHCVKRSRKKDFFPTVWRRSSVLWNRTKPVPLPTITTKTANSSLLCKVNKAMRAATVLDAKLPKEITKTIRCFGLVPTGAHEKNCLQTGQPMLRNLSSYEAERIMGFSGTHTAITCSSIKERKMIGNAWHNSVATALCKGLQERTLGAVVSFFDGVGTIHLTLHKLQMLNNLKVCVCIEKDDACRQVVQNWWQIQQELGTLPQDAILLHYDNIERTGALQSVLCHAPGKRLEAVQQQLQTPFWHSVTGLQNFLQLFHLQACNVLVTGGSPCNNISGNNRRPSTTATGRSGLAGFDSGMFLEFASVINKCYKAWHTQQYCKWKQNNRNAHVAYKQVHKGLKRKREHLLAQKCAKRCK